MRVLSGIQPSGQLHIGNYFGAIRQHIQMQGQGETLYFIANYHAMTTLHEGPLLKALTFDVAASYLALGLDPVKAILYIQSDVPEVTELAWILATVTGMGLLERGTSYKDKLANGITPSAGLFFYPVLMAADILIYNADVVPVGADQIQHIEFARDMAGYLNNTYEQGLLKLPEARVVKEGSFARVPGTDGRKMSKSYGNTLPIFLGGKALRKKIMAIKTDSTPVEAPKDPTTCTVFELYTLFAGAEAIQEMAENYRRGGYGYGHAKQALFEAMDAYFAEARERRVHYESHPDEVYDVLRDGAKRARILAAETMERVRSAVGLERTL